MEAPRSTVPCLSPRSCPAGWPPSPEGSPPAWACSGACAMRVHVSCACAAAAAGPRIRAWRALSGQPAQGAAASKEEQGSAVLPAGQGGATSAPLLGGFQRAMAGEGWPGPSAQKAGEACRTHGSGLSRFPARRLQRDGWAGQAFRRGHPLPSLSIGLLGSAISTKSQQEGPCLEAPSGTTMAQGSEA